MFVKRSPAAALVGSGGATLQLKVWIIENRTNDDKNDVTHMQKKLALAPPLKCPVSAAR